MLPWNKTKPRGHVPCGAKLPTVSSGARIAVATSGPIPGTVVRRRELFSCAAIASTSRVISAMRPFEMLQVCEHVSQ
jgi:hypothetical protein